MVYQRVKIGIPIQCITSIIATVIPKLHKQRSRQYVDLPYPYFQTFSPVSFLFSFKVNFDSMYVEATKINIAIIQNVIINDSFIKVINLRFFFLKINANNGLGAVFLI